ncbi:MAG TPA: inorganic diphosphatase [Cyclobacteriaceae bacterium]|nr:inorganic diphosphatase [Cyclobacteriaceae bacterium]HNU42078.1 inorganic diphosphatase [Cyclobacteriaceae bacterium]
MSHPWHEAPAGSNPPEFVNAIIEISIGMRTKYEVDKETGLLKLDRVLYSAVHYPANYGFIPQSLGEDMDPLDIMVICREPIRPLCLVPARVIGVMRMVDQGLADDKILAVALNDANTKHVNDISELANHYKLELKEFFESYKRLENKTVTVPEFQDKTVAMKIVEDALAYYKTKF